MKSNYPAIMEEVFKSEGGYVDHPRDPGGATNMGITRKTLARWRKVVPFTKLPKSEVKNLSKEEAQQIYDTYYWDEVYGDLLPSGLDYAVFDYGVNSGPQKAVMELQELVGVARDGVVGNKTLAAVAEYSGGIEALITSYNDERLKFRQRLSTWPTFGKGWTARVKKVQAFSLSLTGLASKHSVDGGEDTEDSKAEENPKLKSFLPLLLKIGLAILGAFLPGILKRFEKVE